MKNDMRYLHLPPRLCLRLLTCDNYRLSQVMGGGCEKTAGGQVTIPIWLSWTSLVGASLKLRRPEIRGLHQKRAVMIEPPRSGKLSPHLMQKVYAEAGGTG